MKPLLLLVFFIAGYFSVNAQPQWQWARKDSMANYTVNPGYPRQVIAASNGKAFWATIQNQKISYGQVTMGDNVFRELDSSGKTIASLTGTGKFALLQAQADAAGNWYVLGTFYDTISLSPSLTLTKNASASGAAYFLFRLSAGTLSPDWLRQIGSNQSCASACFTIANNELYLPMDSVSSTHIYKYNLATGAPTKLFVQTGRSYTSYIQADSAGNIYLAGNCLLSGPLNFNGTATTAPPTASYPWYIARYHANGQYHWHHYLTDITCTGRSLKLKGNNELYLSGMLSDSTTLAGFRFSRPPSMFNSDFMMARLDSNGSLIWAKQRPATAITQGRIYFGSQFHTEIVDTTLYLLCESQGASIWGSGGIATNTSNYHLATLISYRTSTGDAIWAKTINGRYTTAQHIVGDGYSIWATGNGMDSTSLTFDTVSVPATKGIYIPYVAKMQLAKRMITPPPPTSIVAPYAQAGISVWPNPAAGYIMVAQLKGGEHIILRDITGRAVLQTVNAVNSSSQRIETNTLARGPYFIEVRGNGAASVMRLMLE